MIMMKYTVMLSKIHVIDGVQFYIFANKTMMQRLYTVKEMEEKMTKSKNCMKTRYRKTSNKSRPLIRPDF